MAVVRQARTTAMPMGIMTARAYALDNRYQEFRPADVLGIVTADAGAHVEEGRK
jgi:hypothetical protein